MTDITELAQSHELLIANGNETANLLRHLANNEIDSDYFAVVSECESYGRETEAELSITDFALRAAGYVDALVEALEKAQAKATQQGNIACALFDEVTQLRRHADEKAPELRAQLIKADSELEALRQRITELEFIRTSAGKVQREFADELGCAGDNESILQAIEDLKEQLKAAENNEVDARCHVAELESRTVKLPDCDFAVVQHMSGGSKDYCNGFVDGTQNAIRAMRAAGVDVREAE